MAETTKKTIVSPQTGDKYTTDRPFCPEARLRR